MVQVPKWCVLHFATIETWKVLDSLHKQYKRNRLLAACCYLIEDKIFHLCDCRLLNFSIQPYVNTITISFIH